MVLFEANFEAFLRHIHLPLFKRLQDLQNCRPMNTDYPCKPFGQHGPSTLILEGKQQLLDFLVPRVGLSLLLLIVFPKMLLFATFSNARQLYENVCFLCDQILSQNVYFLGELFNPSLVLASTEESVLFDLIAQDIYVQPQILCKGT